MKKILLLFTIFLASNFTIFALQNSDIYSDWKIIPLVDVFGRKTGDKYAVLSINGTFNDSATSNSKFTGRFTVAKKSIFLTFYKYGKYEVNYERLNLLALDSDGVEHTLGTPYSYFRKRGSNKLRALLLKGGKIQFVATPIPGYSLSRFSFTVDASDLDKIINEVTWDK